MPKDLQQKIMAKSFVIPNTSKHALKKVYPCKSCSETLYKLFQIPKLHGSRFHANSRTAAFAERDQKEEDAFNLFLKEKMPS
jgi:hypothetical protein